jgi:hypothetical protein
MEARTRNNAYVVCHGGMYVLRFAKLITFYLLVYRKMVLHATTRAWHRTATDHLDLSFKHPASVVGVFLVFAFFFNPINFLSLGFFFPPLVLSVL